MLINTKIFGDIEIEQKDIITFEDGLPGFKEYYKFILLPIEGNPLLYYMQSTEQAEICFVVTNPFMLVEDYQVDISEETVAKLEIKKEEDASIYTILTIPENIKEITANLVAPIIINSINNKASQEIQSDERYSIKYKLYRGE